MSLNATHLRFALEVQNKYAIKNLDQYLSGSIYPDSRYLTGATRDQTHPTTLHPTTDFERGWAAHLWCDDCNQASSYEEFTDFIQWTPDPEKPFGTTWIFRTALKILQDIHDAKQFNITQYLPSLRYVFNPHDENLNELKKFAKFFIEFYKNPQQLTASDYRNSLKIFKIEDSIIDKLITTAEEFTRQPQMMTRITEQYSQMLKLAPRFEEKYTIKNA